MLAHCESVGLQHKFCQLPFVFSEASACSQFCNSLGFQASQCHRLQFAMVHEPSCRCFKLACVFAELRVDLARHFDDVKSPTVLRPELGHRMSFFMDRRKCAFDPATDKLLARYVNDPSIKPESSIPHGLLCTYETLARLKKRHTQLSSPCHRHRCAYYYSSNRHHP